MSLLFGDESIFFIFTASFIYKLRRREGSDERKNLHKHSSFSRHHSRGDWKGVSGAKNFTNILPFLVIDAKAKVRRGALTLLLRQSMIEAINIFNPSISPWRSANFAIAKVRRKLKLGISTI
ncbi:uncharacterized protein LOC114712829 isoform X1 [Neltuma alba]|uniref:uncharacterized protein LOC114712829 isoform X1 n=1 Tax=Neltuma alba TaxID=207710 RepID=UPI0010A59EB8|nr:uncharacterized protein LOC114712829 isoform X1 [Prosopis alba]